MEPTSRAEQFESQLESLVRNWREGRLEKFFSVLGGLLLVAETMLSQSDILSEGLEDFRPGLDFVLVLSAVGCFAASAWIILKKTYLPPPGPGPQLRGPLIMGTEPFGPDDGETFSQLGRSDELAQLRRWILDDQIPLAVVEGESGVGKTSLLRAGLASVLPEEVRLIYWEARPSDSEQSLLHAVHHAWSNGPPPQTLDELAAADSRQQVIVLDQLEQLDMDPQSPILRFLSSVIQSDPPYSQTLLLGFQPEFISQWMDFVVGLPESDRLWQRLRTLKLGRLPFDVAECVVQTLLSPSGLDIKKEAAGKILQGVAEDGQVLPIDIGICLLALNELRADKESCDLYAEAGGQARLLSIYLDKLLDRFPPAQRKPIETALLSLIDQKKGLRLAEGLDEEQLVQLSQPPNPRHFRVALHDLSAARARILERGWQTGEASSPAGPKRYRLAHDRLIPALDLLAGALKADAEQANWLLDHRFRVWVQDKKSRFLLRGRELRQVLQHLPQLKFGRQAAQKEAFIHSSRRRRLVLGLLAAAGLTTFVAAGFLAWQQAEAKLWRERLASWNLPTDLYARLGQFRELDFGQARVNRLDWIEGAEELDSLVLNGAWVTDVQGLPPSVTSLVLSNTGIKSLRRLPPRLQHLDLSSTPVESLQGLPESLTSLVLNGNHQLTGLEGLPPNLKSLDLRWTQISRLENLPATLESLSVADLPITRLPLLPANLKSLNLSGTRITSLESLPAGLISLDLSRTHVTSLTGLPPGLQTLILFSTQVNDLSPLPPGLKSLDLCAAPADYGQGLPRSLESLVLCEPQVRIEALPAALRSLTLNGAQLDTLENLPPHLESLDLRRSTIVAVSGLPTHLRSLVLQYAQFGSLADLPDSLEALDLSHSADLSGRPISSLPELPPHLRTLNLNGIEISSLQGLPSSLVWLDAGQTSITSFEGLPPSLTALFVGGSGVARLEHLPAGLQEFAFHLGQFDSLRGLPGSVRILRIWD